MDNIGTVIATLYDTVSPVTRYIQWYDPLQYGYFSKRDKETNSTEMSPSWEVNSLSASQETPRLLYNPNIHYRDHKSQPVVILSQMNPIHNFPPYFSKIQSNIMLSSTSEWLLSFKFADQNSN
jgi:hypothetical protein